MDLAMAAEFDLAAARRNIQSVRPGMRILEVSSKTGEGMDEALSFLQLQLEASRMALQQD
jgi:hydrogenase nickel incorporation protein HypB